MATKANDSEKPRRLPPWLKRPAPSGERYERVVNLLKELQLNTVCDGAGCPNRGECYSHGTATFLIMGSRCSRNCQFCSIDNAPPSPLAADEPQRLAQAVSELGLQHVVITSVTRDDLADGGAQHFAATITAVRQAEPETTIEVLTPDFKGQTDCLDVVHAARPDVFNHNIETCRRLTGEIRSGADYDRSLGLLKYLATRQPRGVVKSGFMLGLGENDDEITDMLNDLHTAEVTMVTIGQYLRPSKTNRPVQRFYTPHEFDAIRDQAQQIGFGHVAAGPFVRSSYRADVNLQQRDQL